jgi:dihydrofolate reductase
LIRSTAARCSSLMPFSDQLGGVLDTDWFARADAILLGRTTCQIMRPHWSQITDSDDPVAAVLNNHRKYVVSTHSRRKRPPGPTLISDHMFERVAELTEMPGRELQVHGSLKLAKSLHEAGLVDLSDC